MFAALNRNGPGTFGAHRELHGLRPRNLRALLVDQFRLAQFYAAGDTAVESQAKGACAGTRIALQKRRSREVDHDMSEGSCVLRCAIALLAGWTALFAAGEAVGQEPKPVGDATAAPKEVSVDAVAEDSQIEQRLLRILRATEWFQEPQVEVAEGVAILRGSTQTQDRKEWATQLAQNTQDVVAVVNRITVTGRPLWDFSPATEQLESLWRETLEFAPLFAIALGLFALSMAGAWLASRVARILFRTRISNSLIRQLAINAVAGLVLILGVYIVLKVSGLTRLAVTVLGGTGLFGLILGIAFRDIAENYFASILLSVRRPFEIGDLIEVEGKWGIVRGVTTRGTLLMTFEGNHIHIPNSVVYKSVINNYTANPNLRLDFTVGIGYEVSIPFAQEIAASVLRQHPAVLTDPEPLVLVEQLGPSTVVIKPCFWVDIREHSMFKVRSAVIRLVKRAFQDAGISMPDEAREIIFPAGVPVRMLTEDKRADDEDKSEGVRPVKPEDLDAAKERPDDWPSSAAEGGLGSERGAIEEQARKSRQLPEGENLLAEKPSYFPS